MYGCGSRSRAQYDPAKSQPRKGPLDFLQMLGPLGFIAGFL